MTVLANRVKMTVTGTPGTGTITLNAAFSDAFFTFAEGGVGNSDTVRYLAEEGDDFEIGSGVYTSSGTTLTRTVTSSKIAGVAGTSKMDLTSAAIIRIVAVIEDLYYAGGTDVPLTDGGTGSSTAGAARTALGVDPIGTDNSDDVTLAGTPDYITLSGQAITRNQIDLTADVSGDLPVAEGGTGASNAAGAKTNLGFMTDVIDDPTPQLGADLDTNGFDIKFDDQKGILDDSGNEQLIFRKTASAVNEVVIENAATGNAPGISCFGDNTNIDLNLTGKGTGTVNIAGNPISGVLLASGTLSSAASHMIAFPGGFNNYKIEFFDVSMIAATSSGRVNFRFAEGGGPTANTDSAYYTSNFVASTSGGEDWDRLTDVAYMTPDQYMALSTTPLYYGTTFTCYLNNVLSAARKQKTCLIESFNRWDADWGSCGSGHDDCGPVTGFQIYTESGENFDDFTYRVYGEL